MADLSAEPSMEDILSSIKRIIAEEGDTPPARARRPARPAIVPAADHDDGEEVLELNVPAPTPAPLPREETRLSEPARAGAPVAAAPTRPILSQEAAQASRGSLEALSRLVVKPEPPSDGTLEGLVADLLRPMLREWLDAHLPELVESMVAREIAKITGQG